MLKIIPLGGLGEIGMNMMLMEFDETIFVVDAGLMFPEDYMLGVDYVIPDMAYLRENAEKVAGIVLTHAHEDHIAGQSRDGEPNDGRSRGGFTHQGGRQDQPSGDREQLRAFEEELNHAA